MGTTRCHTQCSRHPGSTPPLALRRSQRLQSGARTGALWAGDGVKLNVLGPNPANLEHLCREELRQSYVFSLLHL